MLSFKNVFIIFFILYLVIFLKSKIKINKNITKFIYYILGIYICLVIVSSIFPISINIQRILFNLKNSIGEDNKFLSINYIYESLFLDIELESKVVILKDLAENIIMFIPVGIYLAFLNRRKNIKEVIILGFAFSACIEFVEFLTSVIIGYDYIPSNIYSIILNTIGAVIGYIMFKKLFIVILNINKS
ncbi:VanZ family protein [Paraclostridium sordellii]|uniref:VanZF protein n=1 Tax=Paraclostridium sordellii TaxID=1505 RepID=A0A0C7QII4_PARSO|nr:VanZ family protein [Paeniclostridium sordellii]QYE98840.1 VanZ family protein [Paeniclostridium sordellii]CEN77611.1 vanZF protein [[Clostridium] sordellii] [Paeniclostridium sordellii]CEO06193.1 vanZF protein [[Clostridium] sordellii] [Paeniclostridium sordellii]CEP86422.1 vanZF protein [[Clostridium] sordellii] [Paeniclostridium sordellii]CEP96673.1 vanZF protein [[Clostridium] sordellii] [Paeniclostridium sordellii]